MDGRAACRNALQSFGWRNLTGRIILEDLGVDGTTKYFSICSILMALLPDFSVQNHS
jgi:hypothetical protein